MLEVLLITAAAFLLGALGILTLLVVNIFRSNSIVVGFAVDECKAMEARLEQKLLDFDAVTRKASEANNTIASRVIEVDKKLNDIENRVAMLKMQR